MRKLTTGELRHLAIHLTNMRNEEVVAAHAMHHGNLFKVLAMAHEYADDLRGVMYVSRLKGRRLRRLVTRYVVAPVKRRTERVGVCPEARAEELAAAAAAETLANGRAI